MKKDVLFAKIKDFKISDADKKNTTRQIPVSTRKRFF